MQEVGGGERISFGVRVVVHIGENIGEEVGDEGGEEGPDMGIRGRCGLEEGLDTGNLGPILPAVAVTEFGAERRCLILVRRNPRKRLSMVLSNDGIVLIVTAGW